MRKLLAFLALFGAGLVVLFWLEREAAPERGDPFEVDVPEPVPAAVPDGMVLAGRFDADLYDRETRRILLRVSSAESRTDERGDLLEGVELELFDPESGEREGRATAASAVIGRIDDGEDAMRPRHENRVALSAVEGTLERGAPLVPLAFESAAAELDATSPTGRRLSSDEKLALHAPNLRGGGHGFLVELDAGVLELSRAGWIELFAAEDGERKRARFAATGPGALQLRREGPGPEPPVSLEGWRGTRLELAGSPPLLLEAEHTLLRGVIDPEIGLVIRSLEADGDVRLVRGENHFRSEQAVLTFDRSGELHEALLRRGEESPASVHLALRLDPEDLVGLPAEELEGLSVAGDQITLRREERTRLEVRGPVTVRSAGLALRSNGDLRGSLDEDGGAAELRADGGVVVEGAQGTLEAAHFELALLREAGRGQVLRGTASGGVRIVGELEDDRPFTVTTPDRLTVERRLGALRVVEARDVEVSLEPASKVAAASSVDGPQPASESFWARSEVLRDLELEELSFLAEGSVLLESGRGRGAGERLDARGPDHWTLAGSAERPARVETDHGWARAASIEVEGETLRAEGDVLAQITSVPSSARDELQELSFDRYEIACERLILRRGAAPPDASATAPAPLLQAEGSVRTPLGRAEDEIAIRSERFSVSRTSAEDEPERVLVRASGRVHAETPVEGGKLELHARVLELNRDQGSEATALRGLVARDDVRLVLSGEMNARGAGELLTVTADGSAVLEAPAAGRVTVAGSLPSTGRPFEMTADRVTFSADELRARDPELLSEDTRARGEELVATRSSVELSGSVLVTGTTQSEPWRLTANHLLVEGRDAEAGGLALSNMSARDDVRLTVGESISATGSSLSAGRATGVLRLEGSPARVTTPWLLYEVAWVEIDPELRIIVGSGSGSIRPRARGLTRGDDVPGGGIQDELDELSEWQAEWQVEQLSSTMRIEPDTFVYVLQEPVVRNPTRELTIRASWAVFWIDRRRTEEFLRRAGEPEETDVVPPPPPPPPPDLGAMGFFFGRTGRLADFVREVYFEGPVEVLVADDLLAHADGVYLDLASGHGWLVGATVNVLGQLVGGDIERVLIKADWLRHSADGSLVADRATVTPCDFEEPHLRVVTGDLRLEPLEAGSEARYQVTLSENRIELYDLVRIPLPPLGFDTDEELQPLLPSLRFGDSARFGRIFAFRFDGPARRIGRAFDRAVSGEEEEEQERDYEARYHLDGRYLGSRGALLDLGFSIVSPEHYRFDVFAGTVLDDDEDKGFIRVPEDERDELRLWLRSHGDWQRGKSYWKFVYSDQSDLAVQSEFYEDEFIEYEEDESYLQWKRSSGPVWLQASLEPRVDSFRSEIEELPAATAYRTRAPLLRLGELPLVHTGIARAGYLRRREAGPADGDLVLANPLGASFRRSPFGLPAVFPDGLGEREVLRFDTSQALELPVPLGTSGVKLVPFTELRATAWDEAADPDEEASRLVAEVGARLAAFFWKPLAEGGRHQVAPYVELRQDVAADFDEDPVAFDEVEREIFGDRIEIGTRARFGVRGGESRIDLDLHGVYASDRPDGGETGWLPVEILSRLNFDPFGHSFDLWYEGRLDPEESKTRFSIVAVGTRIGERAGVQLAHHFGRDRDLQRVFEAASIAGIYRWTEKWEFEARQTFSLQEEERLGSELLLRRYGHDVVFEIESDVREGEGSSIGFGIRPRLGFEPSRIGYARW